MALPEPQREDAERISQLTLDLPDGLYLVIVSSERIVSANPNTHVVHCAFTSEADFNLRVKGHFARFLRSQPVGSRFNPKRRVFDFPKAVREQEEPWVPIIDSDVETELTVKGHRLDFLTMLRSGSKGLLVFEQSAVARPADSEPPFYQRWTWANDFVGGSAIVLNDPMLYRLDTLKAGWWFGTPDLDLVQVAVDLVRRAAQAIGLSDRDVVFYGGSAGGFSALQMAAAMPGAIAVVDIPQTDLRTYNVKIAANKAARAAFGVPTIEAVPHELLHRIDVVERFLFEKNVPRFLLLQNLRDTTHIVSQFATFLGRLSTLQKASTWACTPYSVATYSASHPRKGGHFPLGRDDTMSYVNDFWQISRVNSPL